jgi:hypothetical protein
VDGTGSVSCSMGSFRITVVELSSSAAKLLVRNLYSSQTVLRQRMMWGVRLWTGFSWLRIGSSCRLL